ncbi:MAG: Hsp33 family molecular chaperone HslO [Balneolaceae bacterium]|nr:Hsp33 family molecular chaperone HslO [Balneolaceae bacterium]
MTPKDTPIDIETFKFKDRLIKGVSPEGDFKISVIKTTDTVCEAIQRHECDPLASIILAKTLTGASLLASELKGEERVQLQLEGDGPLGSVIAEANRVGEVRGYVKHPKAQLPDHSGEPRLEEGLGLGILTVFKTLYNEAEPRMSTIELVVGDVTTDIAYYMVQSEQIHTAIRLDVKMADDGSIAHAGGLMIQKLPGADQKVIDHLQEHLKSMTPVSDSLEEGYYIDEIMVQALDGSPVKELDRQPIDFFCRCSRDRFRNGLAMLPMEELESLKGESQELVCHFCNQKEIFTKEEIDRLVLEAKATLN